MAKQSSTPKLVTKKHLARVERERRQNRIIVGVALAGILIVLVLLGLGLYRYNLVADVNGEKIWATEWQERVKFQRIQMLNTYSQYQFYQQNFGMDVSQQLQDITYKLQTPAVVGQEVLDQMIDEALIRQEAQKRGISVSEEEVQKAVQENFSFYPDGTPTPTTTPTEFSTPTLSSQQLTLYPSTSTPTDSPTSTVEPTATIDPSATVAPTATKELPTPTFVPEPPTQSPTPYTAEGFQSEYDKMLESFTKYQISEETIRSVYRANLLRQKLIEEMSKDKPHTDEQVWARHILVETEEEAKSIYQELKGGADFVELAKERSKDTGSGAGGGDLGWFGKGAMVPEFQEAAFGLKVGEISQPVKTQFGYHIIQALGHEERPLDDTQFQTVKQQDFNEWLTSQRETAAITTYETWMERVPAEPGLQAQ